MKSSLASFLQWRRRDPATARPTAVPKMTFQFMSDLHLEVGQQYATFEVPVATSARYLILAGGHRAPGRPRRDEPIPVPADGRLRKGVPRAGQPRVLRPILRRGPAQGPGAGSLSRREARPAAAGPPRHPGARRPAGARAGLHAVVAHPPRKRRRTSRRGCRTFPKLLAGLSTRTIGTTRRTWPGSK